MYPNHSRKSQKKVNSSKKYNLQLSRRPSLFRSSKLSFSFSFWSPLSRPCTRSGPTCTSSCQSSFWCLHSWNSGERHKHHFAFAESYKLIISVDNRKTNLLKCKKKNLSILYTHLRRFWSRSIFLPYFVTFARFL